MLYEELLKVGRSRRRTQPECGNGIRSLGLKEELSLGSKRTLNKTFRQTAEL
jgi:hypothetical protein